MIGSGVDNSPNVTLALSKSADYLSIIDKQRHELLYPWKMTPWPTNPVARPEIPQGGRYIQFNSLLQQALPN